jgi:hypothetical protein
VALSALAAVPLRGGEGGQEGQCPDPPGPGDRHQQHQAEPAQATRLDEMAVAGADRVAIDPLGADPLAAPTLDRVIKAQHHRPARHKGVQQQPEQHPRRRPSAPGSTAEDAMVVNKPPLPAEPSDAQDAGHRALPRHQNGADQEHLGVTPTPLLEHRREA